MEQSATKPPQPFLRWAGGKRRIARQLIAALPAQAGKQTYFEPFLGSGSMYFALSPTKAVLGDENDALVECFRSVRDKPSLVWRYLRELLKDQSESTYYLRREEFNGARPSHRRASLFIYLNKTCFNGIWRVNRDGAFNVPFGGKLHAGFPSKRSLESSSLLLGSATVARCDFEQTVATAQIGDVVYFDPPYLPLSPTAFFRHYTSARFGPEDHERVAMVAETLARRGVSVMITEGDSDLVRKWYRDFRLQTLDVRRTVSCNRERQRVRELIITSY